MTCPRWFPVSYDDREQYGPMLQDNTPGQNQGHLNHWPERKPKAPPFPWICWREFGKDPLQLPHQQPVGQTVVYIYNIYIYREYIWEYRLFTRDFIHGSCCRSCFHYQSPVLNLNSSAWKKMTSSLKEPILQFRSLYQQGYASNSTYVSSINLNVNHILWCVNSSW